MARNRSPMLAIATAAKMSSTASTGNRSRDMAQVSDGRSAERAFCGTGVLRTEDGVAPQEA